MRRMIDLCKEQGVPEPEYHSDGHTVKIVFRKGISEKNVVKDVTKDVIIKIQEIHGVELTERQIYILELISLDSTISAKAISEKMSEKMSEKVSEKVSEKNPVNERTIERDLAKLKEMGILTREGGRKEGHWVIINDDNV